MVAGELRPLGPELHALVAPCSPAQDHRTVRVEKEHGYSHVPEQLLGEVIVGLEGHGPSPHHAGLLLGRVTGHAIISFGVLVECSVRYTADGAWSCRVCCARPHP